MTRAGLIVNPSSGKASGKGTALAEMLRADPSVSVKILDRFDQIGVFLDQLATEGVTDLFISSGDGTIQEILTQIAEHRPFKQLPRLALLPHGTTNMTAADLGFRYKSIAAQADIIRKMSVKDLRGRHTIRCVNPRDGRPRHGMFVGTGAAATGTLFCQQAFNAHGVRGNWATLGTLASAVAKATLKAPDPGDQTRIDRPYSITVDASGVRQATGDQLLVLSTTLQKLVLNTRPFWGGKTGSIRTTVLPYPVPSAARWLLPVMYGGESRQAPPRSHSFCSEQLAIASNVMFVIDGEFFEAPENQALQLETGPLFTFICG